MISEKAQIIKLPITKEEADEERKENRAAIEKLYEQYEDIIIMGEELSYNKLKENLEKAKSLKEDYHSLRNLENMFPELKQHTITVRTANSKVSGAIHSVPYKSERVLLFQELNLSNDQDGMAFYMLNKIFSSLKNNPANQKVYIVMEKKCSAKPEKRVYFNMNSLPKSLTYEDFLKWKDNMESEYGLIEETKESRTENRFYLKDLNYSQYLSLKLDPNKKSVYMVTSKAIEELPEKRLYFKDLTKEEYIENPPAWVLCASDKEVLENHLRMFPSTVTGIESLEIRKSDSGTNVWVKICDIKTFNAFFPNLIPSSASCSYVINQDSSLVMKSLTLKEQIERFNKTMRDDDVEVRISPIEQASFIHKIRGLENIVESEIDTQTLYVRTIDGYEVLYQAEEKKLREEMEIKEAWASVAKRFAANARFIQQEEEKLFETRLTHLNENTNNTRVDQEIRELNFKKLKAVEGFAAVKLKEKFYVTFSKTLDINNTTFTMTSEEEKKVLGKGISHVFKEEVNLLNAEKIANNIQVIELFFARMEKEGNDVNLANLELYINLLKEIENPIPNILMNIADAEEALNKSREIRGSLYYTNIQIEYKNNKQVFYHFFKKSSNIGLRLKYDGFSPGGKGIVEYTVENGKRIPHAIANVEDIENIIKQEKSNIDKEVNERVQRAENEGYKSVIVNPRCQRKLQLMKAPGRMIIFILGLMLSLPEIESKELKEFVLFIK